MASDVKLVLREDMLGSDAIFLEADGYASTGRELFDSYNSVDYPGDLMINVHKDSGEVLLVELDLASDTITEAVVSLREHPLPWVFSVPQMKIKEKPLEDVLEAVYRKFKNKLIGE